MANRKNTFLLKRSNIAGKIPAAGDLQLGELALNTADNILYASGTTANSILPIGWDRVSRTGDTMTGGLFAPYLSATTISATTYLNLPTDVFVTGGTYTSGNAIFTNNTGGTFTVSGFNVGGGGGQVFYLNLSQSQNGNRLLSTTASTASEQTSGVTIANGVTSTIASFQSQPLNITLLPGGIWSFYLHSYKQNNNASFNIFVELYKRTSGGTETLLFATDPAPVTTNSPNPSMQLSDGYFSGTSLNVSDSVVSVVRATNTGNQSHIITLVTEGSAHYSYVVSTIPTQQGLTCDTLSGCSIIQTIQTDISNKFDKSGGTVTGPTVFTSGLSANTISATTYFNLPINTDVFVTGATYSNNTFTYINNTGGTFNVLFNTVTGLTVNGNLTVTGSTQSWFSGDSSSDLVRITQTGSGNAFVVEDSNNPDGTPFVIDNAGNVGIGNPSPGGTAAKLTVQTSTTEGGIRIGGGNSTGNARLYLQSSATNAYIDMYGNDAYLPLRIDASPLILNATTGTGNVGIGVSTPTAKLHINNTDNQNSFLVEDSNNPDGTPFLIDAIGNVGVGTLTPLAKLHVHEPTVLGTTGGSYSLLTTVEGNGSGNAVYNNLYTYRDANGSDWLTTRIHDSIGIDNTYKTPGVDTRTWYERDPYNSIHSWGSSSITYMTIALSVSNTAGNVGIGTTTPSASLHINNTDNQNSFLVEDASPDSTPFVIDANGNVGIGTTTPNAKLDVTGSINNTISGQTLSTSYNSPVNRLDINSNVNLGFQAGASGGIFFYVDGSATNRSLWLHPSSAVLIGNPTATSPNATLHVTNVGTPNSFLVEDSDNPDSTPFVIDANGNVGMGTLTPQNVLHVKANPSSTGTATIRVESDASTANASISYYSGGVHRWEVGTGISLGAPYEIYDRVGGQTRFSITTSGAAVFSNGNVGIGTTTPTSRLSVLKGTQSDTISVVNSAAWIGGVDVGLAIGQSASAPYGTWLQSIRPSDNATFPLLLNPSGSSVGIGITVPLATLHTRTVAVPSAGETVAQFDVSDDTSSYLRIYNSTTVDASFVPTLEGKNSAATVALGFIGNATSDTGNESITLFDSRVGDSAVVTRPLFQWNNFGVTRMTMLANGNLGLGVTNPTEKLVVSGDTRISGGLTANTISATNLTVTASTQSLFSGSSSVEMVKIIQAGSGDAFVVQDQANGDASHFVVNASGNTAIGLTAPIGNDKLTVSGNTTVYGTLSATTYAGLPNSGVLVVPIATSSVAIGTGSNDYYLNFKIPYNLTISKVDFSVSTAGSDSVRIGIYRGQDLTAVLVGQSAGGTVSTLNSVPIVAEVGQNLTFSAGSWVVIGVAVGGTTTNLYGSACPANNLIAWTNTTDSSGGFPTNPRAKSATRTSFPSIEITVA